MIDAGQRLREAREARHMSLEEVAQKTRIPRSALEAMEAGDITRLPAPVFVRGFVRSYGTLVGLEPSELLRSLRLDEEPAGAPREIDSLVGSMGPALGARRPPTLPPYAPLFSDADLSGGQGIQFGHVALIVLAAGMFLAAWLMAGLDTEGELEATGPAGVPAIHQPVDGVSGYTRADAGF